MAALSDKRLRELLLAALPGAVVVGDPANTKPVILNVPDVGLVRVYLWTLTPDASTTGRPAGEHKAQIILPGSPRGSRQILDLASMPVALLAYSPVFGVFSTWQADRHYDSGYSANLQVKEHTLQRAVQWGWSVDEVSKPKLGPEVRVAVHPLHLKSYLKVMSEADRRNLVGEERRLWFVEHAPESVIAASPVALDDLTPELRVKVASIRSRRDPAFRTKVLAGFDAACAVCSVQLDVVEAAHIIGVHDPRSRDERWNGLALCRNHHRLFDHRILKISSEGAVGVSEEEIEFLRQKNRAQGIEHAIYPWLGRQIMFPHWWPSCPVEREKFKLALMVVNN